MVAALFELDDSLAVVAPLPALFLGHLHQTICLFILGTLSSGVEPVVAQDAYLCVTSSAAGILHTVGQVHTDLGGFDPFSTILGWAVQSVGRGVFLILFVPQLLELVVEKTLYISQGYMIRSAAGRGHVLGITDGKCKLAFETVVAHSVATTKLCGFVRGQVIGHTNEALHPVSCQWQVTKSTAGEDSPRDFLLQRMVRSSRRRSEEVGEQTTSTSCIPD